MSNTITGPQALDLDRTRIESALARYPHIEPGEVRELARWFRKHASAHDIAMIASNEDIRNQYTLFRRNHVDQFTARDIAMAIAFVVVAAGIVAAIFYLAPG